MPNPKIQKEIKENFNGKYSPYDFTYMATGAYVAGTYLFQYADPKGFSQMADHAFEVRKLSKGLEGEKVVGLVNSGMNNGQEKIDIPADLSEKIYLNLKNVRKNSEKYISNLSGAGKKFVPYLNSALKILEFEKGNYFEAKTDNLLLFVYNSQLAGGPKFITKKVNGKDTGEPDFEQMEKNLGELMEPMMQFYQNYNDLLDLEYEKQRNNKLGWTPLTYGSYVNKLKKTYKAVIDNFEEMAEIERKNPGKYGTDILENELKQLVTTGDSTREMTFCVENMKTQLKAIDNGWDINELYVPAAVGGLKGILEKRQKLFENDASSYPEALESYKERLAKNEENLKTLREESAQNRKKPEFLKIKDRFEELNRKYEEHVERVRSGVKITPEEKDRIDKEILTPYREMNELVQTIDPAYFKIQEIERDSEAIRNEQIPLIQRRIKNEQSTRKFINETIEKIDELNEACSKKDITDEEKLDIVRKIKEINNSCKQNLDGFDSFDAYFLSSVEQVEKSIKFKQKLANKEYGFNCDEYMGAIRNRLNDKKIDNEYKDIVKDLETLNNDLKRYERDFEKNGIYPAPELARREKEMIDRITAYNEGKGKNTVQKAGLENACASLIVRNLQDKELPDIHDFSQMKKAGPAPEEEKEDIILNDNIIEDNIIIENNDKDKENDNESSLDDDSEEDEVSFILENEEGKINLTGNKKPAEKTQGEKEPVVHEDNKEENHEEIVLDAEPPKPLGQDYDKLVDELKKNIRNEAALRKNMVLNLNDTLDVLKRQPTNNNMRTLYKKRRDEFNDSAMKSLYYQILLDKYGDGSRDALQKENDTEKFKEALENGFKDNEDIRRNVLLTKFGTTFKDALLRKSLMNPMDPIPDFSHEAVLKIRDEALFATKKSGNDADKKIADKLANEFGSNALNKNGEKPVPEDNALFEFRTGLESKNIYEELDMDHTRASVNMTLNLGFKQDKSRNEIRKQLGGLYDPLMEYHSSIRELKELEDGISEKKNRGLASLDEANYRVRYSAAVNKIITKYEALKSEHRTQYEIDPKASEHLDVLTGSLSGITGVNPKNQAGKNVTLAMANMKARATAVANGWAPEEAGLIGFLGETKANLEDLSEKNANNVEFLLFKEKFDRLYSANIDKKVTNRYEKAEIARDIKEFVKNNPTDFYQKKLGSHLFGYEEAANKALDPYKMQGRSVHQNTDKLLRELIAVDPAYMRSSPEFRRLRESVEKLDKMAKKLPENPSNEQLDDFYSQAEKTYMRATIYINAKKKEENDYLAKNGRRKARKESTDKRMNFAAGLKDKLEALMIANSGNRGLEFKGNAYERAFSKMMRLQRKEEAYRLEKIDSLQKEDHKAVYRSFCKSAYIESVTEKFKSDPEFTLEDFNKAITKSEIKKGADEMMDTFKALGLKNHLMKVIECKVDVVGDAEVPDADNYTSMLGKARDDGSISDEENAEEYFLRDSVGLGLSWVRFELKNAAYTVNGRYNRGRIKTEEEAEEALSAFGYHLDGHGSIEKNEQYKDAGDDYIVGEIYKNQKKPEMVNLDINHMDEKSLRLRKETLKNKIEMPFDNTGKLSLEELNESDRIMGAGLDTAAGRVNRRIARRGEIEKAEIRSGYKTFDYDDELAKEIEKANENFKNEKKLAEEEIEKIDARLKQFENKKQAEDRLRGLKPGTIFIVDGNYIELLGYEKDKMYVQFHGDNKEMSGNSVKKVPEQFKDGVINVEDMAKLDYEFKTKTIVVERNSGKITFKDNVTVLENATDIRNGIIKENRKDELSQSARTFELTKEDAKRMFIYDLDKYDRAFLEKLKKDHPEIKDAEKKYSKTKSSVNYGDNIQGIQIKQDELKKDFPELEKEYAKGANIIQREKELRIKIAEDNYRRQVSEKQIKQNYADITEKFDFGKRIDMIKNGKQPGFVDLDTNRYYNFRGNSHEIIKKYGSVDEAVHTIACFENGILYAGRKVEEEYEERKREIETEYKKNSEEKNKIMKYVSPEMINDPDFLSIVPENYRNPEADRNNQLKELDEWKRKKAEEKGIDAESIKKDMLLLGMEPEKPKKEIKEPEKKPEKEKPVKKEDDPGKINIIEEPEKEKDIKEKINVINDPTGELVIKMKDAHSHAMMYDITSFTEGRRELTKEENEKKAAYEKERENCRKELKNLGYSNKDISELVAGDASRAERYYLQLCDKDFGNRTVNVSKEIRKTVKETAVLNRIAGKDNPVIIEKKEMGPMCMQIDKVLSMKKRAKADKDAAEMLGELYSDSTGNKIDVKKFKGDSFTAESIRFQDETERKALATQKKTGPDADKLFLELSYKALYNRIVTERAKLNKLRPDVTGDSLYRYEYQKEKIQGQFVENLSSCKEYKETFDAEILKTKPVKEEDIVKISDKALSHALAVTKNDPKTVEFAKQMAFDKEMIKNPTAIDKKQVIKK